MNEYDIGEAFAAIENELIASMIRNMKRHRAEETSEGIEWSMWQAEQLKALEKYKRDNQKRYAGRFKNINSKIDFLIRNARNTGGMKQEIRILQAIKKGFKVHGTNKAPARQAMDAAFFRLNDRKLEALVEATMHDMEKAETAVLRMANDQYRKVIYNAQVYANSGAGTYEKAVDMATKDFLAAGLNCIQYKNGARHTISDYADMAIRTASKRAYLQGEGEMRQEWGIATVIVNKRGNPCPLCLPFCGKVLIDDVWSGGTPEEGKSTGYPLMSYAIQCGLYHPRCKDSHTTYFPGISTVDDTWTKEELEAIGQKSKQEVKLQYAGRQAEKFGRLESFSLDGDNKKYYGKKKSFWEKSRDIVKDTINGHEPLTLNELQSDYKHDLEATIKNSPGNINQLYGKYADQVKFVNEKYSGRPVSRENGIYIDLAADLVGTRGAWSGVFHEIGHSIDRASGLSIRNPQFQEFLKNDFKLLEKAYMKEYNLSRKEVYDAIGQQFATSDKFHSVSDLVGGITNNACVGKHGHFQTGYWGKEGRLGAEAFAHFFEATIRNDTEKLSYIKGIFPNAYDEFLRMIEGEL